VEGVSKNFGAKRELLLVKKNTKEKQKGEKKDEKVKSDVRERDQKKEKRKRKAPRYCSSSSSWGCPCLRQPAPSPPYEPPPIAALPVTRESAPFHRASAHPTPLPPHSSVRDAHARSGVRKSPRRNPEARASPAAPRLCSDDLTPPPLLKPSLHRTSIVPTTRGPRSAIPAPSPLLSPRRRPVPTRSPLARCRFLFNPRRNPSRRSFPIGALKPAAKIFFFFLKKKKKKKNFF